MKQLIAMHGWCSDGNFWQEWEKDFTSKGWLWQTSERGYGNRTPVEHSWKRNDLAAKDAQRVLLCHSLGAHLVPKTLLKNATEIVLINSFGRFLPNSKASRAIKVGLLGMQKSLMSSNKSKMLRAFLIKASSPSKLSDIQPGPYQEGLSSEGLKKLEDDLELLTNTSKFPIGISLDAKVLIINGDNDLIIHHETRNNLIHDLTQSLRHPPIHWVIKNVGHSVIPSHLIKKVRQWLES